MLSKFLLKKKKQDTSDRLYMKRAILAGIFFSGNFVVLSSFQQLYEIVPRLSCDFLTLTGITASSAHG